jgi:hypothetical protein
LQSHLWNSLPFAKGFEKSPIKYILTGQLEYNMSEAKTFGEHRSEWITISTDEYESMRATLDVLSDSELMEQIRDSKVDYKAGNYKNIREIIDENSK